MSNVSFASVRRSGNSLGSFHREVGLANPPAFIEHKNMRFLIMDAPSDASLHMYLKVRALADAMPMRPSGTIADRSLLHAFNRNFKSTL